MITRNIARRLVATIGSVGMLAGMGLTATAASAATSHHGWDCAAGSTPGTITYLKADGYQITTSSSNTWQYLTDAYRDKVEAGGYFAKHAVTVLSASSCRDEDGAGEEVSSPGLITFINQFGYRVTESSSNTEQYQTDAYRDKVEAGGSFAKHAVTVLVASSDND